MINHFKYMNRRTFNDFVAKADKIEKGISTFEHVAVDFLIIAAYSLTAILLGERIPSGSMYHGGEGMVAWVLCPWQTPCQVRKPKDKLCQNSSSGYQLKGPSHIGSRLVKPYFHRFQNLSKYRHHLGTECSDTQACGGHFIFKP